MSDKNYLYFQRGDEKKLHVIRVDAEDKDIYLQSGWVESDVLMWIKLGLSDEARKALANALGKFPLPAQMMPSLHLD